MSLNDGSKEVENGESLIYFAALTSSCRLHVCRAWLMCRNLLGPATRSTARLCYSNVAGWLCTCFNELLVTAHVDDILNTDSNK